MNTKITSQYNESQYNINKKTLPSWLSSLLIMSGTLIVIVSVMVSAILQWQTHHQLQVNHAQIKQNIKLVEGYKNELNKLVRDEIKTNQLSIAEQTLILERLKDNTNYLPTLQSSLDQLLYLESHRD